MRKFLSMLLVLILMFALAVPAFAEEPENFKVINTENGEGDVDISVNAKLTVTPDFGGKVYYTKITWVVPTFTGEYKPTYLWNPNPDGDKPMYELTNGEEYNGTGVKDSSGEFKVTVTNRSNDEMDVTLAWNSNLATLAINNPEHFFADNLEVRTNVKGLYYHILNDEQSKMTYEQMQAEVADDASDYFEKEEDFTFCSCEVVLQNAEPEGKDINNLEGQEKAVTLGGTVNLADGFTFASNGIEKFTNDNLSVEVGKITVTIAPYTNVG